VTHFRSFRNGDPPALADLWNRGVPAVGTARPLSGPEFDAHVISKPNFESDGLIVAECDGQIVGFTHAGFGPENPEGSPLRLNVALGTVGMLVIDPRAGTDATLGQDLIVAAERYLRRRGASVFYAGGQGPLNPFYWGIYGGSEWAGILSAHASFHHAVIACGYLPVSTSVLLESDLSAPEVRDPKAALIRRQARVEVAEDVMPSGWWEALAIGSHHPTQYQLLSKTDGREVATATTWEMDEFGRLDNRTRVGLVQVEVDPDHRRKGFGRHLVTEILRKARAEMVAAVAVQTRQTNIPALAFYQSLGFEPVETSILYRLPAELAARSL
jgi:GNAT superfamily N-acetyltransferase